MKLPITDQFLLDILYPFFDAVDDGLNFLLSNRYRRVRIMLGGENPIIKKYRKDRNRARFDRLIYHLKKNNYIRVENLQNKKAIMLTDKGMSKALKASFNFGKKKKRKDGKWIMIAFDIPQKNRKARNLLRSILQNLGYKMFQQSIWVTPCDVSEKTERLFQHYSLDRYVKIFLIEKL